MLFLVVREKDEALCSFKKVRRAIPSCATPPRGLFLCVDFYELQNCETRRCPDPFDYVGD
jgi:hypothetical protein